MQCIDFVLNYYCWSAKEEWYTVYIMLHIFVCSSPDIIHGKLDQKNGILELDHAIGRDIKPEDLPEIVSTLQVCLSVMVLPMVHLYESIYLPRAVHFC